MLRKIGRREAIVSGAAGAVALASRTAAAQSVPWPHKPVRIICGYAAGGLTDIFARISAEYLASKFGQPFVVENKTGAGSIIAADFVAKAAPDGYTILFTNSTAVFQNQIIFKTIPYDAAKDFTPIAMMPAGKVPLCIHKSVPGNDLAALVSYARQNKTSFGTTGIGSLAHVFCMKLNELYGISMEPVHYRGEAPMWADVSSGVTQAACSTYQGASSALQAGNITPIAVPTKTRMIRKLPNVPTFFEQGATHPYFLLESMVCCMAATGMPREVVERVSAALVDMNATPRVEQLIDQFGLDQGAQGWQDFSIFIRDMGPLLTAAVKDLNITPQ
jgi:tripartite-type tricarboxylate transporter receptor subunit TctC